MRKLNFAFGILVLPFAFLPIQAQTTERNTATVSGRIVLKGEPARNALVYLQPQKAPPSNPDAYLRARTDDNGQFRIVGVAAGSYSVVALAPGFITSNAMAGLSTSALFIPTPQVNPRQKWSKLAKDRRTRMSTSQFPMRNGLAPFPVE